MKNTIITLLLITYGAMAQTIKGNFAQQKNTPITLMAYEGFGEKELAKTTTDSTGNFKLDYPKNYKGAAVLQLKNASSVIVLLNKENIIMQWENIKDFATLKFTNSPENVAFANGIQINLASENKLAGLKYLLPFYEASPTQKSWLQEELNVQEMVFENYLKTLPSTSYAGYYLSIRKLLTDLQLTRDQYKGKERMAQHETAIKKLDFTSDAIWHSGLLRELLTDYYQLMESYGESTAITSHINACNDVWLKAEAADPAKQNELAAFCFNALEKKSLTAASEHIAITMLNKSNCQLDDEQTNLFEQYRKLGIDQTAPDIFLNQKNLKELKNAYKLVVFGASWCPNCRTDYPSLIGKYKNLKEKYDLEIIYVSLDTDKITFENFYKEAPFITYCDAKGWATQASKDYHVFATPTYFLVDKDLKIVAKPKNPEHLEEWFKTKP